jgi:hypothetical protein
VAGSGEPEATGPAAIGVAVLGEDADDVQGLIEAAEEARLAASARGIEVFRRGPSGPGD